jgi:predicted SnoaL-like aldol condensation-catalyzing enzyme
VEAVLEDADPQVAARFLHAAYVQRSATQRPRSTPRALFDAFPAQGSRVTYGKLEQLVSTGDFVLARSAGRVAGTPQTLYDLFRLREGRILEHWGIVRPAAART